MNSKREVTVTQVRHGETLASRNYAALREAGNRAAQDGRIEEAVDLLKRAWQVALEGDDGILIDRALCNLAAVKIEHGPSDELLPRLREILVRNNDAENCRLAAYHLARAYEEKGEYKKGLFYARIARERTRSLESPDADWVASSDNQIGNFLVSESRFEEAIEHYEAALLTHPPSEIRRAVILDNIGYCHLMMGDLPRAFALLYRSLRVLRRHGTEKWRMLVHLDLCLAHLESGRNRYALGHGVRALHAAERFGSDQQVKNALYLLGEAAHMLGDEATARAYFDRLQRHFPETPFLTDFLLAIDIRKMINLRA